MKNAKVFLLLALISSGFIYAQEEESLDTSNDESSEVDGATEENEASEVDEPSDELTDVEEISEQDQEESETSEPKELDVPEDLIPDDTESEEVSDVAASPEPKEEELDMLSEEKRGIQGNWYEKSQWLVKARDEDGEVQSLANEIQQGRSAIVSKYNQIQSSLDSFYINIGADKIKIEQSKQDYQNKGKASSEVEETTKSKYAKENQAWYGSIVESFSAIINWVKGVFVLSRDDAYLKSDSIFDEEKYQEKLKNFEQALTTISNQTKEVQDLDKALEERVEKLDSQVGMAMDEAQKSRNLYDEIWEIIDHNNARQNFFEIKEIKKKLVSIKEYVEVDFKADFEKTVDSTSAQIEKVQTEVLSIKDDLNITTKQVDEQAKDTLKEIIEAKPIQRDGGFFNNWWSYIKSFFISNSEDNITLNIASESEEGLVFTDPGEVVEAVPPVETIPVDLESQTSLE